MQQNTQYTRGSIKFSCTTLMSFLRIKYHSQPPATTESPPLPLTNPELFRHTAKDLGCRSLPQHACILNFTMASLPAASSHGKDFTSSSLSPSITNDGRCAATDLCHRHRRANAKSVYVVSGVVISAPALAATSMRNRLFSISWCSKGRVSSQSWRPMSSRSSVMTGAERQLTWVGMKTHFRLWRRRKSRSAFETVGASASPLLWKRMLDSLTVQLTLRK
mmetsp:Transcript_851/g.2487  ORF Transcript_851/g.2487 Transcript_851/m.2487 type:complete len:220 (+) Transcript_851:426-1085(+)